MRGFLSRMRITMYICRPIKILAAISCAATLVVATYGSQTCSMSPLCNVLAYIPKRAPSPSPFTPTLTFVDYAACAQAEGIQAVRASRNLEALLHEVSMNWLIRIVEAPDFLPYIPMEAGKMAEVVGFEWLVDVDWSLEFGEVPDTALLIGGTLIPEAISAALDRRDFSPTHISGVPVWHRFEDLVGFLGRRDVADPFWGWIGGASRIALLPDVVAGTRTWSMIRGIIAAVMDEEPSLADDPGYQALVETITAEGLLLQASFFSAALGSPKTLMARLPQDLYARLRPLAESAGRLPPYLLGVLADRQHGTDQAVLLALAYADGPTALAAVNTLVQRIPNFSSLVTGLNWVEEHGATVTGRVVVQPDQNLAVALVEISYPRTVDWRGEPGIFGVLYRRLWNEIFYHREFWPLWYDKPSD